MASLLPNAKQYFSDQNGRPLAGGKVYFYFVGTENKKDTFQDSAQTIPNTNPVVLDAYGEALIWGSGSYRQVLTDKNGVQIWDQITQESGEAVAGDNFEDTFVANGTPPFSFIPGTTTTLTLSRNYGSVSNIEVHFDAAYQGPDQIASLVGQTLTFTSPIPVGVTNVHVKGGLTVPIATPATGSVTDASLALGSRVLAVSKLFFTPEMYGAVGDWNGTAGTDDSSAFAKLNAALLANKGGYVYATGRYNVPNGWVLPCGDLVIDGAGVGELYGLGKTYPGNLTAKGSNNITIRGFTSTVPLTNLRSDQINTYFETCNFVYVDQHVTHGGQAGIWFYTCNDVNVTRCYVDTPKADGIHFGQGSSRCKAIGNTIYSAGDDSIGTTYYAPFARPSDIVMADNICIGAGIWGAGCSAFDADNVTITGNNIRQMGTAGINLGANGGSGCSNVTVTGNKIYGACLAEKQPNSYWFGSDPGLDPVVSALSFESGIFAMGTNVTIRGNLISNIASYPSGLSRTGLSLNGGAKITIADNTFVDVLGPGIDTYVVSVNALTITGNSFDFVHGTQIWARSPVATSLSITNNTTGFGNPVDYMVKLQNAGAVRAVITGNTSSIGKTVFTDGTSTNILNSGNYS